MDCNVLIVSHLMIGVDVHDAVYPPAPAVIKFQPHFSFCILHGITPLSTQYSEKVLSENLATCQRGTDMGPFIPHIGFNPINVLTPVIMIASSSISEFGSFTVLVKDNPVATACLKVVNLNLNCGDPFSTPFNIVIAPNTVMAGMSAGDYAGSLIAAIVDFATSYVANKISGLPGGGGLSKTIARFVAKKVTQAVLNVVIGYVAGLTIGKLRDWALEKVLIPGSPEPNTTPVAVNNMYNEGELIK